MPPVRNLTQDAPAAATAAMKDVALANFGIAPGDASGGAIALPSFLQQMPAIPDAVDDTGGGGNGPYLSIATERANVWPQLKAAGFAEGEYYIRFPDEFRKVMPCTFFMLEADVFMTIMNSAGRITAATRDMQTDVLLMEEHIVATLLVFTGGLLVPVVTDARRTASGAMSTAAKALRAATEPNWAADAKTPEQRAAREAAMGFPVPAGRVVNRATTTGKTSASTGNRYYAASAETFAADASQMKAFSNAIQDPDTVLQLQTAHDAFERRVALLTRLAGK